VAKPKIENIYVHTGGLGGQASVHWTIGDRKFHVWMRGKDDQPEDTVHSNPVTRKENSRRDEHRGLDRTCKTQSDIWTEVWQFVQANQLIAKCRDADRAKRAFETREREIKLAIGALDQEALEEWRAGKFNSSLPACAKLNKRRYLELQLRQLAKAAEPEAA